jgi:hypothetical protein
VVQGKQGALVNGDDELLDVRALWKNCIC